MRRYHASDPVLSTCRCSAFAHEAANPSRFASDRPHLEGKASRPGKFLVGSLSDCSAGPVLEEPVGLEDLSISHCSILQRS